MPNQPTTCPVCQGRTTVCETLYNPGGTAAGQVSCRSCGGAGFVWPDLVALEASLAVAMDRLQVVRKELKMYSKLLHAQRALAEEVASE
jgi:hypothetical protein